METLIVVNIVLLLWVAYSISTKLSNILKGQEITYKNIQDLSTQIEDVRSDVESNT